MIAITVLPLEKKKQTHKTQPRLPKLKINKHTARFYSHFEIYLKKYEREREREIPLSQWWIDHRWATRRWLSDD